MAPPPPGWSTLPPGSPPPGWDNPPPGAQPGWGSPPFAGQPGWGQPGYPPPTGWGWPQGYPPRRSNNRGCLIGCLVLALVLVLGVAGCAVVVLPTIGPVIGTDIKIQQQLGSRAQSVTFNWTNGQTTFTIRLAPGQDATFAACNFVKPILRDSSTPNAHFEIFVAGNPFPEATELTPCP